MDGKKSSHKIKHIVLIIAIFLVAFSLLSIVVTGVLFKSNFGRNELNQNEIALSYSDVDSTAYPRDNTQFLSDDTTLQGYIYGETNTKGLIVVAHGIMSGADSYLYEIMYFVDNGWREFAFDGTGTRSSEGSGIRGLPQTKRDLIAALLYISESADLSELPIVLYGHSMGGYAVTACLAGYSHDIRAVICISGFNSPMDTMYYQVESVTGFYANIEYPFIWLYQKCLFGKDADVSAVDGINSVDIPVLVIYGTMDDVVPHDEIGIYAYKEQITNPNVSFLSVDEEGRNWHDNMHLSQEAGLYAQKIKNELASLQDKFGDPLPDSIWGDFIDSVDKRRMNTINSQYMQEILDYYLVSIGG